MGDEADQVLYVARTRILGESSTTPTSLPRSERQDQSELRSQTVRLGLARCSRELRLAGRQNYYYTPDSPLRISVTTTNRLSTLSQWPPSPSCELFVLLLSRRSHRDPSRSAASLRHWPLDQLLLPQELPSLHLWCSRPAVSRPSTSLAHQRPFMVSMI